MLLSMVSTRRLANQGITVVGRRRAADVVAWFGAMQAQEYAAAKWALAMRLDGATDAAVERAIDQGQILRTHVLRPTWHFVAPADIRWMLQLTAPHVHRAMSYYDRQMGLDTATLARATTVVERALGEGRHLTRAELGVSLSLAGVEVKGPRLAHIAMYAELEGVICSGPRRGKQFTYGLIADRAPRAVVLPRDEALAELVRRYFRSHGPATIRDFVWWSGLSTADTKRGLEMNRARREDVDGLAYWTLGGGSPRRSRRATVHLFPVYDEYFVAYRDRLAVPHGVPATAPKAPVVHGYTTFQNVIAVAGQVVGTWRATRRGGGVTIEVRPGRRLTMPEQRSLARAVAQYGRFVETDATVSLTALGR